MSKKLLFFDIDGTLINFDGTFPESAKEALKRAKENGVELIFAPEVVKYLSKKGFDPKFGARPLKRVIRREIEDMLAEEIIKRSGKEKEGGRAAVIAVGVKADGEGLEAAEKNV